MTPGLRRLTLTAHVGSSVGWLGAVMGCAALAVVGRTSDDAQLVRGAYVAVDVIVRLVVVPLALAALVTGVVQALGTHWGLFRHYWVAIKLAVTVLATVVLLGELEMVGHVADMAARNDLAAPGVDADRTSLVVHTLGGSAVLLVPLALSIYKPHRVMRFGRRRAGRQALIG